MNNKYKIKYHKYKQKYNSLKKKKMIGGIPDIFIGILATLPLTTGLTLWSILDRKHNLENRINQLIIKKKQQENIYQHIINNWRHILKIG